MSSDDRYLVVDIRMPSDPEAGIFPGPEAARILRDIARKLEDGGTEPTARPVLDVNGNRCGQYIVQHGEEEDGGSWLSFSVRVPDAIAMSSRALSAISAAAQEFVSETWPDGQP